MHNVMTIAKRELRSYFDSPVAYIVVVAYLLLSGWFYFSQFFFADQADMRPFFAPQFLSPASLLLIICPALTMRLIAEERKSGTIELLTTMPIKDSEIVVGKFVGALALIGIAFAVTLIYPIVVSTLGDLDWGPVFSGYVATFLYAGVLLALGLLCSTLTENQIVSFIVAFVLCAGLFFVKWLTVFFPGSLGEFLRFISVSHHLEAMARGVIDSRNVLYYLSVMLGALFLSVRALERQHA